MRMDVLSAAIEVAARLVEIMSKAFLSEGLGMVVDSAGVCRSTIMVFISEPSAALDVTGVSLIVSFWRLELPA